MRHDWADDEISGNPDHLTRLSDEVFGALVLLTSMRMAGQSLDGLPRPVVDHLTRLLGPDQVSSLLSIDDAELMIHL
jgi:hypothetical protein